MAEMEVDYYCLTELNSYYQLLSSFNHYNLKQKFEMQCQNERQY